jgi:formylglycine-generating enzyme required for sulfatase activity
VHGKRLSVAPCQSPVEMPGAHARQRGFPNPPVRGTLRPPMASRPPSPAPNRVEHYCGVLAYCLEQCADHRVEGHDILLWNARRASEAMLYALAEGTELAAALHKQFDEQKLIDHHKLLGDLERLKVLHSTTCKHLQIVRQAGNLGAHTQAPDLLIDETTLKGCLDALASAVEWFARHSVLAGSAPTVLLARAADLRTDTPRPSPQRALQSQVEQLSSQNKALRVQHDDDQETVRRLRAEIERLSGSEPPLPTASSSSAENRTGALRRYVIPSVVAFGAIGLGTIFGFRLAGDAVVTPSPTSVPSPTPVPSAVPRPPPASTTVASSVPLTPARTLASTAAPPLPVQAPATCPSGLRLVEARTLELEKGPSPRLEWPKPKSPPGKVEVGPFCIDPSPATTASYADGLTPQQKKARRAESGEGCNSVAVAATHPVNCVSAVAAEAHCAARGMRLPSVAEWESAVRAVPAVKLAPGTGEWASDPFPPVVFGYAGASDPSDMMWFKERLDERKANAPHLSWHHRDRARAGLPYLSFRCAVSAGTAGAATPKPTAR